MNILQLLPSGNVSGIGNYVMNLSKGLIGRGHHVVVVSHKNNLNFSHLGIKYYEIDLSLSKFFTVIKQLKRIIQLENIHIINIQHRTKLALFAYYVSKETNIPYVMTLHNPKISDIIKAKIALMNKSGKIITVSGVVAERLVKNFKIDKNYVKESFIGIDTERFFPNIDTRKQIEELNLDTSLPVVSFISRLSHRKGRVAYTLLKLPDLFNNKLQILIIGDGPLLNKLKQLAREKKLIKVYSWRNDIPAIINLSTAVIGTATVCLETLACAKPAIAVGRYGYIGLITPNNYNEALYKCFGDHARGEKIYLYKIVNDIKKILNNPSFVKEITNFGYKIIKEKYNIYRLAEDIEEVLLDQFLSYH